MWNSKLCLCSETDVRRMQSLFGSRINISHLDMVSFVHSGCTLLIVFCSLGLQAQNQHASEGAELPQRCSGLHQLKNSVPSVASGEVMSSSEAHLIWEDFRIFCVSVLNILSPRLLFSLFLSLVWRKAVVVLSFCFRKILNMLFSLKEQLMLSGMF